MTDQTQVEEKGSSNIAQRNAPVRDGGIRTHLCEECGQDVMDLAGVELLDAQDALESSIYRMNSLTESLVTVFSVANKSEHPLMSENTIGGLMLLAQTEGAELRDAFDRVCILNRNAKKGAN